MTATDFSPELLEPELASKLDLAGIEDVAGSVVARDGSHVQIKAAPDRIQVPNVDAVEEVEKVHAQFRAQAFREPDVAVSAYPTARFAPGDAAPR